MEWISYLQITTSNKTTNFYWFTVATLPLLVNIDKKQEANKNEQVHEAEMPPQDTYNDGMRQSFVVLIIVVEDRPSSVQRKTGTW